MTAVRGLSRVIVTGAAGFVGSALVDLLLHHRIPVVAVDDLSKGDRASLPADGQPDFTFVRADLRDRAAALSFMRSSTHYPRPRMRSSCYPPWRIRWMGPASSAPA